MPKQDFDKPITPLIHAQPSEHTGALGTGNHVFGAIPTDAIFEDLKDGTSRAYTSMYRVISQITDQINRKLMDFFTPYLREAGVEGELTPEVIKERELRFDVKHEIYAAYYQLFHRDEAISPVFTVEYTNPIGKSKGLIGGNARGNMVILSNEELASAKFHSWRGPRLTGEAPEIIGYNPDTDSARFEMGELREDSPFSKFPHKYEMPDGSVIEVSKEEWDAFLDKLDDDHRHFKTPTPPENLTLPIKPMPILPPLTLTSEIRESRRQRRAKARKKKP